MDDPLSEGAGEGALRETGVSLKEECGVVVPFAESSPLRGILGSIPGDMVPDMDVVALIGVVVSIFLASRDSGAMPPMVGEGDETSILRSEACRFCRCWDTFGEDAFSTVTPSAEPVEYRSTSGTRSSE